MLLKKEMVIQMWLRRDPGEGLMWCICICPRWPFHPSD